MYKFRAKGFLVCAFSFAVPAMAATPAIGIAFSRGNIVVNNLSAAGNATIFDGNELRTGGAPSQVHLKDGSQVRFDVESRGRLFVDHVELEKGSASVSGYAARANGLRVQTERNGSANVTMHGATVEVAAVTGNVHVFNSQGINVANLIPGSALSLKPQDAGATGPSSLVGCAVKQGNDLLLTDETSNVTVRLNGQTLRTGKRVQLTGAILPATSPDKAAPQVIKVTDVKEVGGTCKPVYSASARTATTAAGTTAAAGTVAAAGTAAAGTATAAGTAAATVGAAAGISTTTAVVAGVAAAAAVGTASSIAASGTSGGSGVTAGVPNCISPCTF